MSCVGMSCYEDGFRLAGPASECSLRSKARIDALFEDSRYKFNAFRFLKFQNFKFLEKKKKRKENIEKKLKELNIIQHLLIYRSIYGSNIGGWYGGVSTMNSNYVENVGAEEQRRVNSAVQARIEAMFASVEAESGTPEECVAAILPVNIHIDYFPL